MARARSLIADDYDHSINLHVGYGILAPRCVDHEPCVTAVTRSLRLRG